MINICRHRRSVRTLWVPNRSSTGGDLGKFVDQSAEPVVASGGQGRAVMQPPSPIVVDELSRQRG
jgi:hypothetical protein